MISETPQPSLTDAWQFLQQEGVKIIPKRDMDIPIVDTNKVNSIYRPNGEKAIGYLGRLTNFLNMPSLEDRFGPDNSARDAWREEMRKKLGMEVFNELYIYNNQLRANSLQTVVNSIDMLLKTIDKKRNRRIYRIIYNTKKKLLRKFKKSYTLELDPDNNEKDMTDFMKERLSVVHFTEDKLIELLRFFERSS